jgi:hypothetical protein
VTNSLWYYLADPEPAAKLSALSSLTHLVLVGMVKANIFLPDNSAAAAAAAASVPTLLEPEWRLAVFACLTYTAAAAAAPDPEPAVKLLALSSLTHLVLRGMVKASVVLPDIHCCRCCCCCCCVRP